MGLFSKTPDQKATAGENYDLTSVTGFKEVAFSCRKGEERIELADLAIKVGDRISCIGKCDAGYPQFQFGDVIINTGWRAKTAPSEYGLQHVK